MEEEKIITPIRFLTFKNVIYLRKEDVVGYIQELAATEETDIRNRYMEAARNLSVVGVKDVQERAILVNPFS